MHVFLSPRDANVLTSRQWIGSRTHASAFSLQLISLHFNHLNGTRVVAQKLQWADVYLGRVLAYPAGGIDGG